MAELSRCAFPPRPITPCVPSPSWPPPSAGPLKRERIAAAQQIPMDYLENILLELKHVGIVQSQRGAAGGFRAGASARRDQPGGRDPGGRWPDGQRARLTPGAGRVPRAGGAPARRVDRGAGRPRELLEATSVQDLVDGTLPARMDELTRAPEAWVSLGRVRGSRARSGSGLRLGATRAPRAGPSAAEWRCPVVRRRAASTTIPMTRITTMVASRPRASFSSR